MERKIYKDAAEAMEAFLANKPRKIEGSEMDGWCGLEGTGFIADVDAPREDDAHQIVMDVQTEGISLGVYYVDGSFQILC